MVKRKGNIDGIVELLKLLKGFSAGGKKERETLPEVARAPLDVLQEVARQRGLDVVEGGDGLWAILPGGLYGTVLVGVEVDTRVFRLENPVGPLRSGRPRHLLRLRRLVIVLVRERVVLALPAAPAATCGGEGSVHDD